jgi:hypothetical protein
VAPWFGCFLAVLAFPCFVSGLLVMPLRGAALTFFAAVKANVGLKGGAGATNADVIHERLPGSLFQGIAIQAVLCICGGVEINTLRDTVIGLGPRFAVVLAGKRHVAWRTFPGGIRRIHKQYATLAHAESVQHQTCIEGMGLLDRLIAAMSPCR